MDDEAKLGGGNVIITLAGEEKILKPTLMAAQMLSRSAGGLMGCIQEVLKLNLDTITQVISVGMGYGGGRKPPMDLASKIWETGLTDERGGLVERCVLYLRVLANGGKMPSNPEFDLGGGGEGDKNPPS
jgi:hypothetical protein